MTLDDSSGFTIEIFCRKIPSAPPITDTTVDRCGATKLNNICEKENDGHVYTTNEGYKVNLKGIDVGSIVKVKGGISEFRGEKQLTLERICKVPTTNEEAGAWAENLSFYRNTLSNPWVVSERKQQRARIEAEGLARAREARRERRRRKKASVEKCELETTMDEPTCVDSNCCQNGKQKREAHRAHHKHQQRSITLLGKQYHQS